MRNEGAAKAPAGRESHEKTGLDAAAAGATAGQAWFLAVL